MKYLKAGCILLLASLSFNCFSQVDSLATKKEVRQQKKQERITSGKLIITPLAGPGYTPELQLTIGAGGIVSWRNSATNLDLPRSSMPFMMALSTTGASTLNLRPTTYWNNDKVRINGDFWYKAMPDHYWGIGYKKAYSTEKTDSTTKYFRNWFQFKTDVLFQLRSSLYAGLFIDANYTKGTDETDLIQQDENFKTFNDSPFNFGFGPEIIYDSRDVPVNAYEGMYLNAIASFYSSKLGSMNNYQQYIVDYRQYQAVNTIKGRTFAWQLKGRFTFGDVPYGEMSQLGTPMDLRGYTWGRYRDKSMVYFLAEYRHKFMKPDGTMSKSGMVTWVGSGTIFDFERSSEYNQQAQWLPNFGVGYRLEVQPRMNLRIDVGIGRETTGFYFNFNEAF